MKVLNLIIVFFLMTICIYGQQVGTPAPQFTHRTLDHGQLSLSDYGGKIVYLFFFGWN